MMRRVALFSLSSLLLTACTTAVSPASSPIHSLTSPPENTEQRATFQPDVTPNVRVEDDTNYSVPTMLGFDTILPVYGPEFVSAGNAPLIDEDLIMGVAIDGEAKAYPVAVLRSREMVVDDLAGRYILVSW